MLSDPMTFLSYGATSELLVRCIYTLLLFVPVFVCSLLLRTRRPYLQLTLWSLVLIRAVLPSDFSVAFSLREWIAPFGAEPFFSVSSWGSCVLSSLCLDIPQLIPGVSNQVPVLITAIAWAGVACFLMGRFITRRLFYRRMMRGAEPVDHGALMSILAEWQARLVVRRHVELRLGDEAPPFTMGIVRPKIFLPRTIAENVQLCDVVIGHEMAHIRRYDDVWVWACGVISALYFFFPPVRYALKQVALQRERVCDQLVVASGKVDAREYARHLLAQCNVAGVRDGSVAGLSAHAAIYSSRIAAVAEASSLGIRGVPLALLLLAAALLFVMPMAPNLPSMNTPGPALDRPADESLFTAPFDRYEIGVHYGKVFDMPVLGRYFHSGLDLLAPAGSPIRAMADGTVVRRVMLSQSSNTGSYGNYLLIRHGEYLVYYTDMANVQVEAGEAVERGRLLGQLEWRADRSRHKQPRLHLEVVKAGMSVDPLPLLAPNRRL